ncbi:MAG: hypothetical protein L0Y56_09555, partial [Nitrospira sp.]|nr:hypothetical protein [Nitrospira sp.]
LAMLLFFLSACSTSRPPLRVTDISVTPEPLIGQVATLHIEVTSPNDEADVRLYINLPPGVQLVSGDLTWQGPLTANQPQAHEVSICTLYEGELHIGAYVSSHETEEDLRYPQDGDILTLNVTKDSVQILSSNEYTSSNPSGVYYPPTPLPQDWASPCP